MKVHSTISSLRTSLDAVRSSGMTVGFVPTMGALHAGHVSLVEAGISDSRSVVVSIFVNPLQFGASEDLSRYPRTLDEDLEKCDAAGVSDVFVPSADEMYPGGAPATGVRVSGISEVLEGMERPGHFDGVATVVTKLFSIVGSCRAYFGEKDWQQLHIVRRLVADLSIPVEVAGCPTVREPDGLAMSSRNVHLSPDDRRMALLLYGSLDRAKRLFATGVDEPGELESAMRQVLTNGGIDHVAYAAVRDEGLGVPRAVDRSCRLLVAARVGNTRLIDNTGLS